MSLFFKKADGPTKLNGVQINQSVQGYALPVVMGKGKIQQTLVWTDGFSSKKVSLGGKGLGGKGGSQYVYSADVLVALCNGEITAIDDVWSGSSWLRNSTSQETYVITGSTPTYTPANATGLVADMGVSFSSAYSTAQTDLGAPTWTVNSGTDTVALKKVPYSTGISPASGTYAVDGSNNYYFSPADVGQNVKISYTFALNIISQQQNVLIPSGLTAQVGGTLQFNEDDGVVYVGGANDGKKFTKVSGTPTVAGTYSVSGSGPATYRFASPDYAKEVRITFRVKNPGAVATGTPSSLGFTMHPGAKGQAAHALLQSNYPDANVGYSGIATAMYAPMSLGYTGAVDQIVYEVLTPDAVGGGIVDCNPIQCVGRVLTDTVWGLGAGKNPFPLTAIDNGPLGTWGFQELAIRKGDATAYSWFMANGFLISPVIDRQDSAASLISKWLEAGQCAAFMSEGLLKLVPYGDQTTSGNGATWTAPTAFAAALDDTCFLKPASGGERVKVSISPWQDAFNTVQVQWKNRSNQYSPEITPESDQAAVDRYGSRIEDPQNWDFITTLQAATFAAVMRVRRMVYTRNTYTFALPFTYSWLECMDVVNISTTSTWAAGLNNIGLGIANRPVRITKIVDNPGAEGLQITAEDYPFGVHQPDIYNKAVAAGIVQVSQFADPGDTTAVIFEAPSRLTGYQGNQIWIGASGASDNWGGCYVLASADGVSYKQVGTINSQARLGTLDSAFGTHTDPDAADALIVDLVTNSPALEAGTTADADAGNTLAYVDGEIIAYSACAISGEDQYRMDTYIRRGQMGTSPAAHAAGTKFLRLDDSIFKYTYDPTWAGKTIYLKFQSFNSFQKAEQDPSGLTPVTFTIPGLNPGAISPVTGAAASVEGSGSSTVAASAASNVATAPSGRVLISDGSGNVEDSGVNLSALSPIARTTATLVTGTLATNAVETGTVPLAKSLRVIAVQVSQAARVRLYSSTTQRDADVARAFASSLLLPPYVGTSHGCLLDLNLTSPGLFYFVLCPGASIDDADSTVTNGIPYTITNLGASAAVTVTFTYLPLQA